MRPTRPSIKDVAARARVAPNTVSRVVNGLNWVAPETRERVLRAIEELGYQRNSLAGGLRSGRTQTIGMLISDIANPLFAAEARGVQDAADAAGHQVILCNTDEDPRKEDRLLRTLREKQVDGAIVIPCDVGSARRLARLSEDGRPVVLLNRSLPDFDSAVFDIADQVEQGIEHLIGRGHRRIGLITRLPQSPLVQERLEAYRTTLERNGIEYRPELVRHVGSGEPAAREAALDLLALPRRPTALFASSDRLTLGALLAAREKGLDIPDDLDLVGCNVARWSRLVDPPLTLVQTDPYRLGATAAELLLARLRGDSTDLPRQIRQAPALELGESAGSRRGVACERRRGW
jgi:LacI family transcriptional regulator